MQRLRLTGSALVATALLTMTTACGEDTPDSDETVVVNITDEDGSISPSGDRVEAQRGQAIDIVVTADRAGSIHVHSDPEQEFAYEAGTQTFAIEFDRAGVIEVESHETDPAQIIVTLEIR
ncbi:hypothetical protein ACFQ0K_02795 [Nocardioides caeni]|uniref:EfeO-type cupredoxin-like domain-containing protein n=1 Tax=Nocardioides caeni TaxID=574700 RepID=A0A4S8NP54_9ACTN|nr:hypothetical protein [Nocardioides caeni]THV18251.1 hypothetical protein E9934_01000 [Nocardioides caeni]